MSTTRGLPRSRSPGPMPPPPRRRPICGSSLVSTSAISQLTDGSHPGKSMPAARRTRLRPPSQPTRYSARSVVSPDTSTSTPPSSCARPTSTRTPPQDRNLELADDPVGEDALEVALPEGQLVVVAGREVADVQEHLREAQVRMRLPRREEAFRDATLIEHLDGAGLEASGRDPSSSWVVRRSTITTSVPAKASSLASISPVGPPPAITTACSVTGSSSARMGRLRQAPPRGTLRLAGRLRPRPCDDDAGAGRSW